MTLALRQTVEMKGLDGLAAEDDECSPSVDAGSQRGEIGGNHVSIYRFYARCDNRYVSIRG